MSRRVIVGLLVVLAVALVLWLPAEGLSTLAGIAAAAPGLERVFLSSSLAGTDLPVPDALRDRVRLVHPFAVPDNPRTLATLPEDPTRLLGGLPNQYDAAVRLQLQNIPTEHGKKHGG